MEDRLAELILEHDVILFPYLKMRAMYAKKGKNGKFKCLATEFSMETLELFYNSGYIRYDSSDDVYVEILLREDGRWLCDPPETRSFVRKEAEEYIPKDLIKLAEIVGYPVDWANKPGKYRKLFFTLTNKHDEGTILSVAKFMKEAEPEWDLSNLLTTSYFSQIKSEIAKSKVKPVELKYRSRADQDYTREQPF
jgi:hypothetical protein